MSNRPKTPWAVICSGDGEFHRGCGQVFLTEPEYMNQLGRPDSTWRCPLCGMEADWDDDNYEEYCNEQPPDVEDCMKVDDLVAVLANYGYPNVWIEDTDSGVVIHGVSLAHGQGGSGGPEYLVPECWMNK